MLPRAAVVVDASVATKWHLKDEEHTEEARLLLTRFAQGKTELLAPDYIRYEVPNAITVATQGRTPRITKQQGKEAIEEFLSLQISTIDSNDLILSAYSLVHQYHCALYDGFYLALANRLNIPLLTADRKLYHRIRHLPAVLWLGDYSPAQEN
jgi:predicted nucleic acid-binding protein